MTEAADPGTSRPSAEAAAPLPLPLPAPSLPRAAVTLRIFGALLWAYVVLGEWVIGLALPEPFAILLLAAVFGWAWLTSVRGYAGTPPLDKLMPGPSALTLWVLLLLLTSAQPVGVKPIRIEAVSAALACIGAATFLVASRWRRVTVPAETIGPQWARGLAWGLAGVSTLLAIGSVLNRL